MPLADIHYEAKLADGTIVDRWLSKQTIGDEPNLDEVKQLVKNYCSNNGEEFIQILCIGPHAPFVSSRP